MPTPFVKKPQQAIIKELEMKIDWYEKGLKEIQDKILNEGTKLVNVVELLDTTIVYLNGEPTTADKFNESNIANEYSNNSVENREIYFIGPNDPGDENDNKGDDVEYNYGKR